MDAVGRGLSKVGTAIQNNTPANPLPSMESISSTTSKAVETTKTITSDYVVQPLLQSKEFVAEKYQDGTLGDQYESFKKLTDKTLDAFGHGQLKSLLPKRDDDLIDYGIGVVGPIIVILKITGIISAPWVAVPVTVGFGFAMHEVRKRYAKSPAIPSPNPVEGLKASGWFSERDWKRTSSPDYWRTRHRWISPKNSSVTLQESSTAASVAFQGLRKKVQ